MRVGDAQMGYIAYSFEMYTSVYDSCSVYLCANVSFSAKHQCCAQSLSHVWLCDPMDCSPPGFSVHGVLQASILEWVAMPSPRGFSQPPGKPKNTGVGRLYPLQGIFSTQESNWGLLHCRRILYQLRYQEVQTSMFFLFSCLVVSDSFATP